MPQTIETDRLLLSAPKLSEVPALFSFLGNKVAMKHTHCDASLKECRRRIAVHEWRRRHDGFAPWTVRIKQTRVLIGWGGLYDDPFDPGWGIELAYYFDPSAWGNGYATELCHAALEFSDQRLELEKVSAFAPPDNSASNALLKKMGFEYERFVIEMERNLYTRRRQA
ncbi:GNAT family N-acetyltransferase [Hoeflea prorocentri]|uniref:GNAT family N-acetyltransferase n=1 Tax=Hoeflea prorocentri TaxID=1922333 RepID=A0A9X3UMA9_9HYPH|nr:GNAT family N-acetyltransferase [Hoeflea prorocentri]MCY6383348.1 GNAT family N-acetyltransferase [Hoeflea prorocentri]MDA5401148.1 GNAT family N-acetyltransferase [Hoeflea prorocentri]